MILPSLREIEGVFRNFIQEENISFRMMYDPKRILSILFRHKFLHFLFVGATGVALNLSVTWFLTTYVFGLEQYFKSYLIGTAINLLFNFVVFSIVIFGTSRDHVRRLFIFLAYIISVILIQAYIIKTITPIIGLKYYLLIIATSIAVFSIINFMVFKLSIFKERSNV